jgi:hypothetical protein
MHGVPTEAALGGTYRTRQRPKHPFHSRVRLSRLLLSFFRSLFLLHRIRSLTFGILAYGGISREIARLAKSFGANVIVCTRAGKPQDHTGFRIDGTGDPDGSIPSKYYNMEKESVREFLGECDVVVSSGFSSFASPSSSTTLTFILPRSASE